MTKLLYVKMDAFVPCDILVVGGQITATDEMVGDHFTGRGGSLVRQAFADFGANIQRISFTSLVKVRPEGDRKLTDDEVYSWVPSLWADILDTGPQHIVTFGRVAARAVRLLSDRFDTPVTNLRHPDIILKNPELKDTWTHDIGKIVSSFVKKDV